MNKVKEGIKKAVLIADDEQPMCESLRDQFIDCNERADCPYGFEVDLAASAAECVQRVRAKSYDVIVLDIRMEEETSGLQAAMALAEGFGPERPVRIIFTGYRPSVRQCVEFMRHGAWDYIIKEDVGGTPAAQLVVDSALDRLRQLDLRREQEQQIATKWLPRHFRELQAQYGGRLLALWHQPKITVITNGCDAFELEVNLKDWRKQHATWEQPMIVLIPPLRGDDEEEG